MAVVKHGSAVGFAWVRIGNVAYFSYSTLKNSTMEVYGYLLREFVETIQAVTVVGGNFNEKSPA